MNIRPSHHIYSTVGRSPHNQLSPSSIGLDQQLPSLQTDHTSSMPFPNIRDDLSLEEAIANDFNRHTIADPIDTALISRITEQVIDNLRSEHRVNTLSHNVKKMSPQRRNCSDARRINHQSSSSFAETSLLPRAGRISLPPTLHKCHNGKSFVAESLTGDQGPNGKHAGLPSGIISRSAPMAVPKVTKGPYPCPRQSPEVSQADKETPIERIWQPLFDAESKPTLRLSQFLRGLAIHIINNFKPEQSMVLTPRKMLDFYQAVAIPDDIFPWTVIFGKLSNNAISKIYRSLQCTYHFVQASVHDMPSVPALTPSGFERWMTLMIDAHPDLEHARLQKAASHMPISNADDAWELFPTELPRRLLPRSCNLLAQQRCAAALAVDPMIKLQNYTSFPPPPPYSPMISTSSTSAPEFKHGVSLEITKASSPRSFDDSVKSRKPSPIIIERERKPYSAQPGRGKIHDEEHLSERPRSIPGVSHSSQ